MESDIVNNGSKINFYKLKVEEKSTEDQDVPKKGLSLFLAAVFIVGEMAGSGVLALPKAVAGAGWSGVALLFICALNALYAGICLGRCWMMLEEQWQEYKDQVRYPYPAIAFRAVGPKTRCLVSICMDITLFGVATVFLLLSAQIASNLVGGDLVACHWVLILAAVLCPLTWLGTPKDFWPAAVAALATTLLACALLVASFAEDHLSSWSADFKEPDVTSFFLSFGTVLFSFGGAATFPTFQNDMRDRSEFPAAATIAFAVLLLMYAPVSALGYAVYGSEVQTNVLDSLPESAMKIFIQVLLVIHLFTAFLLVFNPPAQELEEHLSVPKEFTWKRCAVRTLMMIVILFAGLSVPQFGKVLNLIGGSTVTLMTFVFPPYFYMKLCSQVGRTIPLHVKVYLIEIMAIGIIGGAISTYSAVGKIVGNSSFRPPCYVNITAADIP